MYSALNRLQAVFGFFTTVAFFVACLAALTTLLFPTENVSSRVALTNVEVIHGRPHYYSTKREEYARIRFDLEADFTPLFNWNTKQIFVYVLTQYPPSKSPSSRDGPTHLSELIIWDTIIPAPESEYSYAALKERFLSLVKQTKSSTKAKAKKPSSKSKSKSKSTSSSKTKAGQKGGSGKNEEQTAFAVLSLKNQKSKYQISDISGKIAERENVTLTVGWNVQPWVGLLWWSPGSGDMLPKTGGMVGRSKAFNLPALKSSGSATKAKA